MNRPKLPVLLYNETAKIARTPASLRSVSLHLYPRIGLISE
jgi:hypothetical protein